MERKATKNGRCSYADTKINVLKEEHLDTRHNCELYQKTLDEVSCDSSEKYMMLEKIGHGATSEVFKGLEVCTRQYVAIKVMKLWPSAVGNLVKEHLYTEIANMKKCCHPNIGKYLDSYVVGDTLWLVMEYISGLSLEDIVIQQQLTSQQIAAVCREVLSALHYLHSKKIVHRDVSSKNIILGNTGTVKLIDFGHSTNTKDSCRKFDHQVDILSLGLLVIDMLCGKPCYGTEPKTVGLLPEKKPQIPNEHELDPEHLNDFLGQCLEVDKNMCVTADDLLKHKFLQYREYHGTNASGRCCGESSRKLMENLVLHTNLRQRRAQDELRQNMLQETYNELHCNVKENKKRHGNCCIIL